MAAIFRLLQYEQMKKQNQMLNFSSPDFQKVIVAIGKGAFQPKVGEVQHDLHVHFHNDLEDTVSIVGVIGRVVG